MFVGIKTSSLQTIRPVFSEISSLDQFSMFFLLYHDYVDQFSMFFFVFVEYVIVNACTQGTFARNNLSHCNAATILVLRQKLTKKSEREYLVNHQHVYRPGYFKITFGINAQKKSFKFFEI